MTTFTSDGWHRLARRGGLAAVTPGSTGPVDGSAVTQCPVPAMPQQPMLIMRADPDLTAEQVDEIKRRLAATLASPQMPVVMVEPHEPMDPEEFLAQFDNPSLRGPIHGPPRRRARKFLLRWLTGDGEPG